MKEFMDEKLKKIQIIPNNKIIIELKNLKIYRYTFSCLFIYFFFDQTLFDTQFKNLFSTLHKNKDLLETD